MNHDIYEHVIAQVRELPDTSRRDAIRWLLTYAKTIGMVPRFQDWPTMQERMFPFQPVTEGEFTQDAKIVDSYLTALTCTDFMVALRSYVCGEFEVGQTLKLPVKVIPLSTLSDVRYITRQWIEDRIKDGAK